ncbi:MAG: RecX family transcriptional regulator [Arenicella sp.]|nr:RecX family transcriptional regulator [Arenicella sp.]
MKIIKPLRRSNKGDSSKSSEKSEGRQGDYSHKAKVNPQVEENAFELKSRKPQSKKKRSRSSVKRSKYSNDYKSSLSNSAPEEQFEFDTSNLEAMPKDEVFEGPSKGKTRRRSELQAEKASEPLSFVIDPAKKEFNDVFARGLRLLAMREHSVKELTTKLFARVEGSRKADRSNGSEDADTADTAEEVDNAEGSDRSQGSDVIYAVIDDLLEKKYLSDERFTEVYIRSRCIRGFGPIKIRAELKNKGVSNNLIQDYLDPGGAVWFDNAKSEYQKKYIETSIDSYKAWAKRARFLQSRGFTMEQIHCAIAPPEDN